MLLTHWHAVLQVFKPGSNDAERWLSFIAFRELFLNAFR